MPRTLRETWSSEGSSAADISSHVLLPYRTDLKFALTERRWVVVRTLRRGGGATIQMPSGLPACMWLCALCFALSSKVSTQPSPSSHQQLGHGVGCPSRQGQRYHDPILPGLKSLASPPTSKNPDFQINSSAIADDPYYLRTKSVYVSTY